MERKDEGIKVLKIILLILSLFLIVRFTLLFRHQYSSPHYELGLFWSYRAAKRIPSLRQEIILNYLLYVPFGFSLGLLGKKWWMVLLICFGLSNVIELIQLVGRIGLFEFDDIFGNTIGGMIGFSVAKLITRLL